MVQRCASKLEPGGRCESRLIPFSVSPPMWTLTGARWTGEMADKLIGDGDPGLLLQRQYWKVGFKKYLLEE